MRHHAGSREITITISPELSKVKEPTKDHTAMFFFRKFVFVKTDCKRLTLTQ